MWRSGDLREKLAAVNAKISSIRTRWQVRGAAQVSEADFADHYHGQMRLQISTLVSTNVVLGRLDSVHTETTAQFQQVPAMLQQILAMLQQDSVRQESRSLSILPYDRIKLRLEEYRTLLTSDLDAIVLPAENGNTVICREQANEMEEYLDRAEILLRDQPRDSSTIDILHHLRDLAEVLDNLGLYDECRLTGNCALDLAEALGRRSLELRHEQAEALTAIAGLSVYQPCARTLFIQAVSICEELVANNASYSNKTKLLLVLGRAGSWAPDHLCSQWLDRAVQIMTKELPPAMVQPEHRGTIYSNYGHSLVALKQYDNALKAFDEAISIRRTLANDKPAKHNSNLAETLMNFGGTLHDLGKYDDALLAYKEALGIYTTMSAQGTLRDNEQLAGTLYYFGNALMKLNHVSEAATMAKQAISLLRNLARTGHECTRWLCAALHTSGYSSFQLGQHKEAVVAYQESILLRRVLVAANPDEGIYLITALHNIANSFHALEKRDDANAAANEALERNHGRALECCFYAPDFKSCFVCQRAIVPNSP